jgi:hypothetical protein
MLGGRSEEAWESHFNVIMEINSAGVRNGHNTNGYFLSSLL